jgi:hypothetical protein
MLTPASKPTYEAEALSGHTRPEAVHRTTGLSHGYAVQARSEATQEAEPHPGCSAKVSNLHDTGHRFEATSRSVPAEPEPFAHAIGIGVQQ